MSNLQSNQSYRDFRRETIARCVEWREQVDARSEGVLAKAGDRWENRRARIHGLRAYLRNCGVDMLAVHPETERHIRRALGIPAAIELSHRPWHVCLERLLILLPLCVAERRLKALLRNVRSLEGRQFLFEHRIDHTLLGQFYFGESFDFVCRHMQFPSDPNALQDLGQLDIAWLRAGLLLGIRDGGILLRWVPPLPQRPEGELVVMLIEEGVLKTPADVLWIQSGPARWTLRARRRDRAELARQMVRTLVAQGLDRPSIARRVSEPWSIPGSSD